MVIALIGESCTGKSTIADILKMKTGADVFSGKDYLKMAKNADVAKKVFSDLLMEKQDLQRHVVYVISEEEHLELLPEKSIRILLKADIDIIKKRFSARMNGSMPQPVEAMLERKHGIFDSVNCDMDFDTGYGNPDEICREIMEAL